MGLQELLTITFVAALVTDLATGVGAVPFFFIRTVSERLRATFTAAAAGMMTAASVSQLLGEALRLAPGVRVWEVAAGLGLGVLFLSRASRWLQGNHGFDLLGLRQAGGTGALMIVIAMTLHSLPEGVAIGVAFGAAPETGTAFGLSVAAALAFHNIPEGLAITVALRGRGVSTLACVGWALLSSLPQPIGAVPAAGAVWLFAPLLPAGLSFAAGAMMYLVVEELIPDALGRCGPQLTALGFGAGLIVMVVLGRLVGIS